MDQKPNDGVRLTVRIALVLRKVERDPADMKFDEVDILCHDAVKCRRH